MPERGGYDLMPELGYKPTNKYLPPRTGRAQAGCAGAAQAAGRAARGAGNSSCAGSTGAVAMMLVLPDTQPLRLAGEGGWGRRAAARRSAQHPASDPPPQLGKGRILRPGKHEVEANAPALSVILFTTASGAGYAMLALLGLFGASGVLSAEPLSGWIAFVVSLGMVSFGLVSSTLHLGHPERAWRAFSQWRSSWLSREGVLAVFTFLPAGIYAIGWLFLGEAVGVGGLAAPRRAFATVCATAMIYATLKPIRAWHNLWTVPGYLALGLSRGALWFTLWAELVPAVRQPAYDFAAIVAAAIALKQAYWRLLDSGAQPDRRQRHRPRRIGRVRMLSRRTPRIITF